MTNPPVTSKSSTVAGNVSAEDPSQIRILLVEDAPSTRLILEKRLTKAGYVVDVAEDGQFGWEKAQQIRPDVIISDWMMPRMDGHEFCQKIRSDPNFLTTYFILLTAKDCKEDLVHGLSAGADDYLIKPCDPQELLARVRAAERIVWLQRRLEENNQQLERAIKRINEELSVTSEIQRSLLPQELLEVPGYSFAAYYRPSTECSGDYYDLFDLGNGKFGAIMADVSGHGTPAMVAMALARSIVHMLSPKVSSCAELLERLNKMLYEHLPTSQFMTTFYCVVDAKTGNFQYSSAGHNPPLLVRSKSGDADYLPNCEGFPIKLIKPDAEYQNYEGRLEENDSLLLYTDGIPEATNALSEQFDTERLSESVVGSRHLSPEMVLGAIMQRLIEFTGARAFHDDVTMMLITRSEFHPDTDLDTEL